MILLEQLQKARYPGPPRKKKKTKSQLKIDIHPSRHAIPLGKGSSSLGKDAERVGLAIRPHAHARAPLSCAARFVLVPCLASPPAIAPPWPSSAAAAAGTTTGHRKEETPVAAIGEVRVNRRGCTKLSCGLHI